MLYPWQPMKSEAHTSETRSILYGTLRGNECETRLPGFRETIEAQAHERGGRLCGYGPAGIVIVFRTSKDAIECATAIQRDVGPLSAGFMDPAAPRFGFGVHRGPVELSQGRASGTAVDVATRLECLSDPGGVCVSGDVRSELRDEMDLHTIDVGLREIEEGRAPVAVHRLIIGKELLHPEGGKDSARFRSSNPRWTIAAASMALMVVVATGFWFGGEPSSVVSVPVASVAARPPAPNGVGTLVRPTLVVVPFRGDRDTGENPNTFAGGVSEALESDLLAVSSVQVVVPPPHAGFGERSSRNLEITRDLGARYALEGRVERIDPSHFVVVAELFDAENGFRHFHAQYEREIGELPEVRRAIRERILAVLEVEAPNAPRSQGRP